MARPFHQYGTTVSSAWHNRFIDMAQTLPAYDIIGKTKSTNFQNEKYKKGMSFKYYINGA